MISKRLWLFGRRSKDPQQGLHTVPNVTTPPLPEGTAAYVIGDVHGCFAELLDLLGLIKADISEQRVHTATIVFLGDLIDRGPKSAQVIEYLRTYQPCFAKTIFIMGNHEEVFQKVLGGNVDAFKSWFGFGGRSCVRSYGVDNLGEIHLNPEQLLVRIQNKVPKSHLQFIAAFQDYFIFGPYLCVHAGIRPKVKLQDQKPKDLRWIRESFMSYTKPHPYIVVHGHTVVDTPELLHNRIAVDTGAHKGNALTAVCLSHEQPRFIQSAILNSNVDETAF